MSKKFKAFLQKSPDGSVWTETETSFNTKQTARLHMNELAESQTDRLDWRVGFELRLRSGMYYRVVTEDGKVVPA